MRDETLSTFQDFLYEMVPPIRASYLDSPLFAGLKREADERKAIDDAYLASLSDAERRRVLLQRRIEDVERRYRAWWEDNMAWRFRADPPYCGCEDY